MGTFNTKKKRLTVGKHAVIDQKAIHARVIGQAPSKSEGPQLSRRAATELTVYPSSMFHADGQMRVAAVKSTLKKNIQVDV